MASIGALPGMRERTITVNGFSKGFAMTGWRLGYAAAAEPIAKAMVRMQSTITTGANQFVQRAAIAALEGPREEVERMRLRYQARRDMVLAGLRAIEGVRIGNIPATFYAFPDVSALLGRKAGNHVMDTTDRAVRLAARGARRRRGPRHGLRRTGLDPSVLRRERSGHSEGARPDSQRPQFSRLTTPPPRAARRHHWRAWRRHR